MAVPPTPFPPRWAQSPIPRRKTNPPWGPGQDRPLCVVHYVAAPHAPPPSFLAQARLRAAEQFFAAPLHPRPSPRDLADLRQRGAHYPQGGVSLGGAGPHVDTEVSGVAPFHG